MKCHFPLICTVFALLKKRVYEYYVRDTFSSYTKWSSIVGSNKKTVFTHLNVCWTWDNVSLFGTHITEHILWAPQEGNPKDLGISLINTSQVTLTHFQNTLPGTMIPLLTITDLKGLFIALLIYVKWNRVKCYIKH